MQTNLSPIQEWQFPTIIRGYIWNEETKLGHVQLYNHEQEWLCATYTNPFSILWFNDELTGYARVIRSINQSNEPMYVLINFKEDRTLQALHLAHPDFCPIEGVVIQTRELVQRIQDGAIQQFVAKALSLEVVNTAFWTCPASLRDHHSYAGGLAQHSLEVATMISCSNLCREDKDIGIAFALLHDVGKISSYEKGSLTDLAREIGHEMIGFQLLEILIAELEHDNPEMGFTLRELLNGNWRVKMDGRRPLAIGSVVNAFDHLSCERNLQKPIIQPSDECYHRDDVPFFEYVW